MTTSQEFDDWASSYDEDVQDESGFPFMGYGNALNQVVQHSSAQPSMSVLDLGVGSGNLAARFVMQGCNVFGADFSREMIAQAEAKFPFLEIVQADVTQPLPAPLNRYFDRIVSGYMFHEFPLETKVEIFKRLADDHLAPDGHMIIADIAFETQADMDAARIRWADTWDEEDFWVIERDLPALSKVGLETSWYKISDCAAVFVITPLIRRDGTIPLMG